MKKALILLIAVLISAIGFSQEQESKIKSYSISAQYNQEFVLDGYVRVREWEVEGDKMKLKDLNMTSYPALQLHFEKRFRKNQALAVEYDQYFMSGRTTFNRDVAYNGTIIDGRKGIDVSPTRYYRISAIYTGPIVDNPHFNLHYKAALVFDHITFYLDGEVTPSSTMNEVYEGFGRQALPYPVFGLQGKVGLSERSNFNFEVSGTYIPRFTSFYTESGNVDLQYSNFLADISYSRVVSHFELALGSKIRQMHLFQESTEDTNIISTLTAGPYIEIAYHF